MPNPHGPIFCCMELRKKVGVKVRFSIGVSECTRIDFLSQNKHRTVLTYDFLSYCHFAHTARLVFESYCSVTMAGDTPFLDYVTPIFYRTEVSAHGPIFYCRQIVGRKGAIFYRTKSQRTRTDFPSDFFVDDNKSVRVRWVRFHK